MGTTDDCSAENETRCDTDSDSNTNSNSDRQRLLPGSVDYDDLTSQLTMKRSSLFPILVILKQAAMRFWAFCTTSVLLLVLVYWFYGGFLSILLLIAAFLGKSGISEGGSDLVTAIDSVGQIGIKHHTFIVSPIRYKKCHTGN